jgi:hypothetical protein
VEAVEFFFFSAASTVFTRLASMSVERASLLGQAALVADKTPESFLSNEAELTHYMAVTLIPGSSGPTPSFNEANQSYQVAYNVTRESDLANVSIAVGGCRKLL